jgi:V8-like Glu-specific endopeptidase
MRKLIAALTLSLLVVTSPSSASRISSVMMMTNQDGSQRCTMFSINQEKKLWATALHCVVDDNGYLDGEQLRIIATGINEFYEDIAVVKATVGAVPILLSPTPPIIGTKVFMRGFPYPSTKLITFYGWVVGRHLKTPSRPVPVQDFVAYLVYDWLPAPGVSGSPVTNNDGMLVGITWGGYTGTSLSFIVPWEVLVKVLSPYME